jgi:hypothetical protein
MKVLQFPVKDVYLSRLETVQDALINYTLNNEDNEADLALNALREAIFWYTTAFDDLPLEIVDDTI